MAEPHLFNFILRPIEDVAPWGNEGSYSLSWFGLTDGWYWMNAGGVELLRYSQRLIDATPGWGWERAYIDYQVVRLYEDVLTLLPYAIDPIPADIMEMVRTPERLAALEELADAWHERHWAPVSGVEEWTPERLDIYITGCAMWERVIGWWHEKRFLDAPGVAGYPEIYMWREGEIVFVRWRNTCRVHEESGLPWVDLTDGVHSLPIDRFIGEVQSFHDRLMKEMGERVEAVRTGWGRPDVHIDVPGLIQEHSERTQSLARALADAEKERMNWDEVREAVAEAERLVRDPAAKPRRFAWMTGDGPRSMDGPRPRLVVNPHHDPASGDV